jgi:L-lactate dehydrogenase complex protein LldG
VSDARDVVLGRIRAALGPDGDVPEVPRRYRQAGSAPGGPEMVDLFCERAAEYRASVRRVAESEVGAAVAEVCRERGTRRLAVAPGAAWEVDGVERVDGGAMAPGDLDAVDGVLTGCALAVAETGTIVLDSSPACGPRALTLVPDHHVCVVLESQIVPGVPDAVAALREAAVAGRPITMVSGPSATSDIELERVEGVHGPRRLDVVVVGNS